MDVLIVVVRWIRDAMSEQRRERCDRRGIAMEQIRNAVKSNAKKRNGTLLSSMCQVSGLSPNCSNR